MNDNLTRISDLPHASELKQITQSLAVLDAILMPSWDLRYFSFNDNWAHSDSMASMRDGCGNEYFMLFNDHGVIGKVFTQKLSHLTKSGLTTLFDSIPINFNSFLSEPAFVLEDTSFIFWEENKSNEWFSKPLDTNLPLLGFLSEKNHLDAYLIYADEYYEKKLNIDVVNKIFSGIPLNEDLIRTLNNESSIELVLEDIQEIGYPLDL